MTVAAALLLMAIGVAALWLRFNAVPPALGEQIAGDLVNYFYPLNRLAAERLSAGELPLWNPDACSGIPLLATLQVAVFYPGTWLSVALPSAQAMPLVLGIECLLGGGFCVLLFLRWGAGSVSAAAGGLLFVYACLLGQTFWPPQVHTIVWLPWLLLCVESLARRWQWRWWVGLALGTALQILAGFPQYVAYTWYLLGPYALLRMWACREPALGPRLAGLALAAALGLGLAAVQLLPTLEAASLSGRGTSLTPEEIHYLTGLDAPLAPFFANVIDPTPKLRAFDFRDGSGYLGLVTLPLLLIGAVFGRPRGIVLLMLAVGGAALLLSFGYRGPTRGLYEIYAALPAGDLFRTPERFRLLVFFSAISVAVLGLAQVERRLPDVVRIRSPWARVAARACPAAIGLLLAVDLAASTGAYGSLRAFPSAWSQVFHAKGATVIAADELARLDPGPQNGRVELLDVWPLTAPAPIRVPRIACYEPLAPRPWPELFERMGGDPVWGQLFFDLDPDRFAAFYDAASVRHIVVHSGRGVGPVLLARHWHGKLGPPEPAPMPGLEIEVRSNDDALPRAYRIERFEVATVDEALEHLTRGDVDFRELALVDRDPGLSSGERGASPARITLYEPERVEIQVEGEREALLVLTDTWYPGWSATLDGNEREILRANGVYRAVSVPPGHHRVVFEYRPASLGAGIALSVVSAAALGLVPLFTRGLRAVVP